MTKKSWLTLIHQVTHQFPSDRPQTPVDSPTYPWPSMEIFMTDFLFSSPRLYFSEAQKKAVLKWAKAMGMPTVPALSSLKQCQEKIKNIVGDGTEKVTSAGGNIFYLNSVARAISLDYANPLTRLAMTDYPKNEGSYFSDHFSGEKMLFASDDIATPSVSIDKKIFFVDELLQCRNGQYFIPQRFFYSRPASIYGPENTRESDPEWLLCAAGFGVERTELGFIVDESFIVMPIDEFEHNFETVSGRPEFACGFTANSATWAAKMPHPLREKSQGRRVLAVPLIVFMDDVSGNVSKQWNKHHAIYMSNANLPREMIEKEFCVRFVTSSPHASPMELMAAMKDSISKARESGVIAYDAKYEEEVFLLPYALFFGSDNPMQAEECSHGGLRCNLFCRTCKVGGTKAFKQSDEGFASLFKSSEIRTPEETTKEIHHHVQLAMLPGGAGKVVNARMGSGVHDSTTDAIVNCLLEMGKSLRKSSPGQPKLSEATIQQRLAEELERLLGGRTLDDAINPLLGMVGVNIHLDTPTEILHTVLLGVVKYFWAQTVFILEKLKSLEIFHTRLSSLNAEGLNTIKLNADYLCQYKGSLIGKHFKSLAQVMPFLIHDLVPQSVLNGWTVIGRLVVLLWHTTIEDREAYLAELSRVIEDFLTITAQCAPSILLSKPKFHFLIHIPGYIRRFGPAILFSTERYESFNHVFRLTCIHSNRQAPSRDSCRTFSIQDRMKHIVFGGYWLDPTSKRWVRAGHEILHYVKADPARARYLGFTSAATTTPGAAKLSHAKSKAPSQISIWPQTQCASIPNSMSGPNNTFYKADNFVSLHGDTIRINQNIITEISGKLFVAKVIEILVPNDGTDLATKIGIQAFEFLPALHSTLHLPRLQLSSQKFVALPTDILCAVNVQHDCLNGKCNGIKTVPVTQERLEAKKTQRTVVHSDLNAFILNTHSLHNYKHIRAVIPPHLAPEPLAEDSDNIRRNAVKHIRASKTTLDPSADSDTAPQANNDLQPEAHPFEPSSKKKGKGKTSGRATHKRTREETEVDETPKRRKHQ
ncbi:hypothetical protein BD779DRAFT_1459482 [Infundibulicybe gibba]|nr:hypothetical protein BD779DRAFT_1459482 [Infundibulicybe gibba]